jgi:hypothetical protein
VVAALVVLVALAGTLGARLLAGGDDPTTKPVEPAAPLAPAPTVPPAPEAPPTPASVPEPLEVSVEDLEAPCWACPESQRWSLRFKTDLDLLAPLGDGEENAAVWFARFRRPDGPRLQEAQAANKRRVEHPSGMMVFPPDDPLLLEAEPWVDRATMTFYPDILEPNGWATQVPNLLFALNLAKSWIARGHDAADDDEAITDFRRAVRLGRLLRQEDTTIITDLVGLACIRLGAEAIYDRARKAGDTELALVSSVVLGEVGPQRLLTSNHILFKNPGDYLEKTWFGGLRIDLEDDDVETMIDRTTREPDRRFRLEAILSLNLVRHLGTWSQRSRALEALNSLADSPDPFVADFARWSRDHEPDPDLLGVD